MSYWGELLEATRMSMERINEEEEEDGCNDGEYCDWVCYTSDPDVHSIEEYDGNWECLVTVQVVCTMCGRKDTVCFSGEGTSIE